MCSSSYFSHTCYFVFIDTEFHLPFYCLVTCKILPQLSAVSSGLDYSEQSCVRVCHSKASTGKNWFHWNSLHSKSSAEKIFILKRSFLPIAAYHSPHVRSSCSSSGVAKLWNTNHSILTGAYPVCISESWKLLPYLHSASFQQLLLALGCSCVIYAHICSLNIAAASKATQTCESSNVHPHIHGCSDSCEWLEQRSSCPHPFLQFFYIPGGAAHLC